MYVYIYIASVCIYIYKSRHNNHNIYIQYIILMCIDMCIYIYIYIIIVCVEVLVKFLQGALFFATESWSFIKAIPSGDFNHSSPGDFCGYPPVIKGSNEESPIDQWAYSVVYNFPLIVADHG